MLAVSRDIRLLSADCRPIQQASSTGDINQCLAKGPYRRPVPSMAYSQNYLNHIGMDNNANNTNNGNHHIKMGYSSMYTPMSNRTSSGVSSTSSSMEALGTGNKVNEDVSDPAVEVDLNMFLSSAMPPEQHVDVKPDVTAHMMMMQRKMKPLMEQRQRNDVTILQQQLQNMTVRQQPPQPQPIYKMKPFEMSQQYCPKMFTPSTTTLSTSSHPISTAPMNRERIRCTFCWKSYTTLCKQASNIEPASIPDGPWMWHSLYDNEGRITCPRLWFVQLERAGESMIKQMI